MDTKLINDTLRLTIEKGLEINLEDVQRKTGKSWEDCELRRDLGADSLDTYELVYSLEEAFGISIPDEKANEFRSVKEIRDYIQTKKIN